MYNINKKIHSVKVKYGYIFDSIEEDNMIIFKTIEEFEKWEIRNPECDITSVKIRYKKKK